MYYSKGDCVQSESNTTASLLHAGVDQTVVSPTEMKSVDPRIILFAAEVQLPMSKPQCRISLPLFCSTLFTPL